jgi:hypothetical protein
MSIENITDVNRGPLSPVGTQPPIPPVVPAVPYELYPGPPNYQPLDDDLTALSRLTEINVIYFRDDAALWAPVIIGTGLAFNGGTLEATGGGGGGGIPEAPITGQTYGRINASWARVLAITGDVLDGGNF